MSEPVVTAEEGIVTTTGGFPSNIFAPSQNLSIIRNAGAGDINTPNKEIGLFDFNPVFKNKLSSFNSDLFDYLYDCEPQSQNLFWAGYFCEIGNGSMPDSEDEKTNNFYNACYRIKSINIPMPGLEFEMHKEYRTPIFKNINYSQELTIDWYEDVYHSVAKYHSNWVDRWYNRYYDVLRCGIYGKFRKMFVVAFHYMNSSTVNDSPIEVPTAEPICAFEIGGMVPKKIPDMKFDYTTEANDSPLSITYNFSKLFWSYNEELFSNNNKLWNPLGINSDFGDDPKDINLESKRTKRDLINSRSGGGAIG